jgi:hypothetical protein
MKAITTLKANAKLTGVLVVITTVFLVLMFTTQQTPAQKNALSLVKSDIDFSSAF